MKHITAPRLDELEVLIGELRAMLELKEKKRGVFYRKSRAFLHFHEDPAGLFCDVRLGGGDFDRYRVSTKAERQELARLVQRALADS
jgi:hypothetical protein